MATTLKFHLSPPTGTPLSGFLKIVSGDNFTRVVPNDSISTLTLQEDNCMVFDLQPKSYPVANYVWEEETLKFIPSDGWTEKKEGLIELDSDTNVKIHTKGDGVNEIGIVIVGTTELGDIPMQHKVMHK